MRISKERKQLLADLVGRTSRLEGKIPPEKQPIYVNRFLGKLDLRERKIFERIIKIRNTRKNKILAALKKSTNDIKNEFPFVNGTYVFGSFARGNIKPADLDVMLVIDEQKFSEFRQQTGRNHPEETVKLMLSHALKHSTGLKIGTVIPVEGKFLDMGYLFFDKQNPHVLSKSLEKCMLNLKGDPKTHKPPFRINPWHFIGVEKEIVESFVNEYARLKAIKL